MGRQTRGERCTVQGCRRPMLARGLCSTHYMRRRERQSLAFPVRVQRSYSDDEVQLACFMAEAIGIHATARDLDVPRATVQNWVRGSRRSEALSTPRRATRQAPLAVETNRTKTRKRQVRRKS